MKLWKLSLTLIIFILSTGLFAASEEESTETTAVSLATGTSDEKIEAMKKIATKKDKSQIPELVKTLKNAQDPLLASEAAITLGVIGERGESTTALKQKIESSEDGNVVYACILALFNIHRKDEKKDPEMEAALKFAFQNRRQDPYVVDILEKIKKKYQEDEDEEDDSDEEERAESSDIFYPYFVNLSQN